MDYPRRKKIRLPHYDYRQAGVYFVTICTHAHAPLFGEIVQGELCLSPYGVIAWE